MRTSKPISKAERERRIKGVKLSEAIQEIDQEIQQVNKGEHACRAFWRITEIDKDRLWKRVFAPHFLAALKEYREHLVTLETEAYGKCRQ